MTFPYLSSLLKCAFWCLLNGPLLPQVLLITSAFSSSWTTARSDSEALD